MSGAITLVTTRPSTGTQGIQPSVQRPVFVTAMVELLVSVPDYCKEELEPEKAELAEHKIIV